MDKELNTATGVPTEAKCPFAGGASAHDECELVAEPAEPERFCTSTPPCPIRWARSSTTLRNSRAST